MILSDDFEAPFQELLDWPSFSIKWPTARIAELYDYLTSLPQQLVVDMKSKVDANACWFDYYSSVSGCSPFAAVGRLLQKRLPAPAYAGSFWQPAKRERAVVDESFADRPCLHGLCTCIYCTYCTYIPLCII